MWDRPPYGSLSAGLKVGNLGGTRVENAGFPWRGTARGEALQTGAYPELLLRPRPCGASLRPAPRPGDVDRDLRDGWVAEKESDEARSAVAQEFRQPRLFGGA